MPEPNRRRAVPPGHGPPGHGRAVAPATTLVVRLDNDGDVLLAGPTIRAVGASGRRVALLCGPRGRQAAAGLPGVETVLEFRAPWIDPDPTPVDAAAIERLIETVRAQCVDEALVLTSFHQDPLPMALVLRLAGVGRIGAICEDYPGTLLDVRHRVEDALHEVERGLSLAAAMGHHLAPGDDDRLRVRTASWSPPPSLGRSPYVVVHPGASVPARAWPAEHHAEVVRALARRSITVLVTGGPGERALTAAVAQDLPGVYDLGGETSFAELADLLSRAAAVVVGNTGPAHLAAAVGCPVVSVFAPTVPAARWRPWRVPVRLLEREVVCAGCRARVCPVAQHPCMREISATEVLAALTALTGSALGGGVGEGRSGGPAELEVVTDHGAQPREGLREHP